MKLLSNEDCLTVIDNNSPTIMLQVERQLMLRQVMALERIAEALDGGQSGNKLGLTEVLSEGLNTLEMTMRK